MARWRDRRWSGMWTVAVVVTLAVVLRVGWRSVSQPWLVVSSSAGTVVCDGERVSDPPTSSTDPASTEPPQAESAQGDDWAEIPYLTNGACTWRFVVRNRGRLPARVVEVSAGDAIHMRREIIGCAEQEQGPETSFTPCAGRRVGVDEDLVVGMRLQPAGCEWSNGGNTFVRHEPTIRFGLGPAKAEQSLYLDTEFRIQIPSVDDCPVGDPDPDLIAWLTSYLEGIHGRGAAASARIHHVRARRFPMRLDWEDTPDGNRAAIFSTTTDQAACVGILGFWRTVDVDEALAGRSKLIDAAAALTMRCTRPGETVDDTPLVIAARLVNPPGKREIAPHVLVAGWAGPSREIAVHPQLPTAAAGDDWPRMAGLRRSESGVFSFSLWGLSGLTESIALKLDSDSTIPVAIEGLAPVAAAPGYDSPNLSPALPRTPNGAPHPRAAPAPVPVSASSARMPGARAH